VAGPLAALRVARAAEAEGPARVPDLARAPAAAEPAAPVLEAAARDYAATRTGRDKYRLPTAQNRHGSSTALVMPIRRSTDT
jgi:hypothetical protein